MCEERCVNKETYTNTRAVKKAVKRRHLQNRNKQKKQEDLHWLQEKIILIREQSLKEGGGLKDFMKKNNHAASSLTKTIIWHQAA